MDMYSGELGLTMAQKMLRNSMMTTNACSTKQFQLNPMLSNKIPDTVGPQKFPRANEDVKSPETTAWISILSEKPAATAATWAEPKLATRTAAQPNPCATREPQTVRKLGWKKAKYGTGPIKQ
eukprot:TRINITY_DN42853_c0_g1_i1.p2 TRINITY_DN42853_c0_g1~~TRINITY_DN42853_c0_g1_i1.p2  ORF type:complete len:123 (-),score=27.27 TRINITY_DN42853_c0_g1_i1:12-380(-)